MNLEKETTIDFKRMMDIVRESKFKGFIGVEFEGNKMAEKKGIELTRNLIQKYNY
jgi:hypothetical protein